ncbi:unnamed protein product [Hapterophycus canaliculatus]
MMKSTGRFSLCCVVMIASSALHGEAFLAVPAQLLKFKSAVTTSGTRRPGILIREKHNDDVEVSVFDAGEMAVSWEDYKKLPKPDEYKLDNVDEMQCWNTDECAVEDQTKFTKAWQVRSAERNPTTETHFDSEGEWEEESAW